MYMQGYNGFSGYQQGAQTYDASWQQTGQAGMPQAAPPLPTEAPPPDPMPPAMQQQTQHAWGQEVVQQPQQDWSQQQGADMSQQQWPAQQWQAGDQQQTQQWQGQSADQQQMPQPQWQEAQTQQQQWQQQAQQWQQLQKQQQQQQQQQWQQAQPQQQQAQPQAQPQQQPKVSGKDNWRELWKQQLQQQQLQQQQQQQQQQQPQQQQWGQGMGMGMQQQWGQQGMAGQQAYDGMYNQQQYNQQQQGMMYNQYTQPLPPQPQPPQPPPPARPPQAQQAPQAPYMVPSDPQQAWGSNNTSAPAFAQQQGGPMGLQVQQGGYAAGTGPLHLQQQHMQPQGPSSFQAQQGMMAGTPASTAPTDYNRPGMNMNMNMMMAMGGAHAPQQQHPQPHQPAQPPVPSAAPAAPAVPARPPSPPRPLDLAELLQGPGRASRPKRLLLLLRGPPGCGKSHLARTIRSMEVSAGGQAPRLHSLDDYFMVDMDEQQASKRGRSGSSSGGVGTVQQEYQYDADLEPSYWKSLLRAAGKTLGDGLHPLVLLDAPALRAEQVREVWKVAQGAGAELLVVNPLTTDPEVCFKQNVHKHSLQFIQRQAKLFEPVPANFTSADATYLFEDKPKETSPSEQGASSKSAAPASASINEVDMAVDEDSASAAAVAVTGPGSPSNISDPAAALPTPSSKPRVKSSRWEDDSDIEEDLPAAAVGPDSSRAGGFGAAGTAAGGGVDGSTDRGAVASDEDEAAVGAGGAAARPKKKARLADGVAFDAFDAESLLAGVNKELEWLDAAEGGSAAAAAAGAAGGVAAAAVGRLGSGPMSGMSGGAANSSGSSGGRLGGILKKHGTPKSRCKKVRVRWPDLSQEAHLGFRVAAPIKPLAEVFWVEGLGPSKELWMAEADILDSTPPDVAVGATPAAAGVPDVHNRHSFADQVRAEHRAEHDLFRAILLGHSSTPAGPTNAQVAPGF